MSYYNNNNNNNTKLAQAMTQHVKTYNFKAKENLKIITNNTSVTTGCNSHNLSLDHITDVNMPIKSVPLYTE